jgi:hypothetical protein
MMPVSAGDRFTYLGVDMICIATKVLYSDATMVDSVLAHYFNKSGDLKEAIIPPNGWPGIIVPNSLISGASHETK